MATGGAADIGRKRLGKPAYRHAKGMMIMPEAEPDVGTATMNPSASLTFDDAVKVDGDSYLVANSP